MAAPPRIRPQCWEFLVLDDMLLGPAMALVDLLRAVNLLAGLRPGGDDAHPVGWQWRGAAGPLKRAGLPPGPGRRRACPDVLVCGGWHARSGPHLDQLVLRDRAAAARMAWAHARGAQVLVFYTGVALAGAAGLLEARRAAVPWPFAGRVGRHAPSLVPDAGSPWVRDGALWSAASPAAATETGAAVLEACGLGDFAASARDVLLPDPERQRLAAAAAHEPMGPAGPGAVERARRHLEAHLHEPYSLAATARAAALSERSLLRHFGRIHGQTPLQMLHALRVTRARMLLETSYLPIESIAERCGWQDPAMLRQAFRRATGLTPAAYRARFRLRDERRASGRELEPGATRSAPGPPPANAD